jgi:hypothetical protein
MIKLTLVPKMPTPRHKNSDVKIQHCFCDLGSHFEALESVLVIFFLVYASKKYDQTDSRTAYPKMPTSGHKNSDVNS